MKMINKITLGFALIICCGAASPVWAQDVVVIANSGVQLTGGEVADVFLGEKQFAGSVKLIPVDNGPLQEAFLSKALNMDSAKYGGKWAKKSFREGINPPAVKSGDAEVIEYVKHTPGAVGYVTSSPSGLNIVKKY